MSPLWFVADPVCRRFDLCRFDSPPGRNHDNVISGLQYNLVISVTMHPRRKVIEERYQEVMVALSESVMKNRLKHPLEEKS